MGAFVELKTAYRPINDEVRNLNTKVREVGLKGVMELLTEGEHLAAPE